MTATLHKLDISAPAGADVIATLEAVLEKARAGELSCVAVAMVYRDGCTGQRFSDAPLTGALIGSLAIGQQRLIAQLSESSE